MRTIKFLEEASIEFQEAAAWYELRSKGLGERFRDSISRKIEIINQHPERYPKKKGNFRAAALRTFPFIIIYIFYKKEGIILITSIFHMSRNPRNKYRKS